MEEIKNKQLKYCLDRLTCMECETERDVIFRMQCISAIWGKIYKEQPELNPYSDG